MPNNTDPYLNTRPAAPIPLPSGLVTFLFTDIEGSTPRWRQHEETMRTAVPRHFELLRAALDTHGGVFIKDVGDALQAAFATPRQAAAAAIDAQRAILAEPWPEVLRPFRVRMALHTGEATPEGDRYPQIPALNQLSRLLNAGHGGQILVSETTWRNVRDRVPEETSLRDLGLHRLRDFDEERIFQLQAADLPSEFPQLKTLPLDWPQPATRLVGREAEIDRIRTLLGERRLVTLLGPPGVGKTRLAIAAAEGVVESFPDGVYFVDLSALVDPALVASTIATAIGASESGGGDSEQSLADHLRAQTVLLVLDNFEHLLAAAKLVSQILATCRGVKVLATSREPLNLIERGEQHYPVEPLPVPDSSVTSLEEIGEAPSVILFTDEARRIDPRFELTHDNAAAVAAICQRLDGLPLAIRLAAGWIRSSPPDRLLRRLERRLDLLTRGGVDLPERQRTMRGAVAWSYDLLAKTPNYQKVFRLAAVFRGPFSYDALEKICGMQRHLQRDLPSAVQALTEKSLLQPVPTERGAERYRMLAVIQEYAEELLHANPGEARDAAHLHAVWYRRLAQRAAQAHGRTEEDLFRQLAAEHDNLRLLLERQKDTSRGLLLLELATDLSSFWGRYGFFSEGRSWLEAGLQLAPSADAGLRASAYLRIGNMAQSVADFGESQ